MGPIREWLAAAGYRIEAEVPILGRRADLVGIREDALVAVELKLRDWREALRQAIAYQVAADHAWVAMPLAAASAAYRQRWRFQADGVGLLAVDDQSGVRAPIPAKHSPRLLPFLRDRVAASPSERWRTIAGGLPPSWLDIDHFLPGAEHDLSAITTGAARHADDEA